MDCDIKKILNMKIKGIVIKCKQKGRKLGFPTANLKLKDKMESGAYAGRIVVDNKKYRTGIFVNYDKKIIEAHIIGFSGNLYGRKIEIEIGKKIRKVLKFKDDKKLKSQIKKDVNKIRNL